ncbi:response regulator transcription factor [Pontivivens insulae]|uniref:Alkaline phosphatase synthesis transcriptional regulatory protein PhoP n=1 Tax=Pontivivens insulae TaxID=1639689 RepID=A0A2R8ADD7_9RHOB|nr:response regulator [Pontivivens insulae]RED14011.1 response regulator receiver domain-containing protein [Pontivivens insulae]SPF30085.1 Alkaline phosphatase synthesis transcriptional regulatory protein PhoP [Pontivivens insulae]
MTKRVLIVEDETNIVESLSFLLGRAGFEVQTVADGALALDKAAHVEPDVMILDVMLPNVSGFDVLRGVRANPALTSTPVMMLTAKGQSRDREQALQLGADVFVTKPFSNADIVAEARRLAGLDG